MRLSFKHIPEITRLFWEEYKEQRRLRKILSEQGLQAYLDEIHTKEAPPFINHKT